MVEKIKGKKEVQSHISLLTSYVLVYKRVQAYINTSHLMIVEFRSCN